MASRPRLIRSHLLRLVSLLSLGALSACQTSQRLQPEVPPSPLRLLESRALELPDSCQPQGSVVVDFIVLASGQTDAIRPAAAPECVQQALTAWVASFRYSPIGATFPATVEWLLVEAKKGS
ncbi:hypothetical protein [Povalibacter sp.]|uniref:hypothetical protein n=1 Tax=Povalibacter sp. TaxID=1962978 RepID=UPI002F4182ED